jgi:ribosomal protein S18 acetylase RimI-like enzyme
VKADDSIRPTIRRVQSDEGEALKAVRLAALSDSPFAFGSTHRAEAGRPDTEWAARARAGAEGIGRVSFFALLDDEVVGLIGAYRPDEGAVVELVSMWTAPGARRSGVGRALVGAVLEWAASRSAATVRLWVTDGNTPALRLYESLGFRATGESQPLPSNSSLRELRMALDL